MNARGRLAVSTALACALGGCALLGKSDALEPRYFSPDSSAQRAGPGAPDLGADAATKGAIELRLGRITAPAYLGERIVYRDSNYELNFYEERRWTERPEDYLRRALARSFFEERGLRRVVSGAGPTLDVELVEFAELRRSPAVARVSATYVLYDNRVVRREATVTMELPIPSTPGQSRASPELTVRAMSDALNRVVEEVADRVIVDLSTIAPDVNARPERPSEPPSPLP